MGGSDVSGTIMEALKAKIGKSVICRLLSANRFLSTRKLADKNQQITDLPIYQLPFKEKSVSGDLDSKRKGIGFNNSLNNKQKIEMEKLKW